MGAQPLRLPTPGPLPANNFVRLEYGPPARKVAINPMPDPTRLQMLPPCGARARRGTPCRAPEVKGRPQCSMHGGAAGSGAPADNRNGRSPHGLFMAEAIAERRSSRELVKQAIKLCVSL